MPVRSKTRRGELGPRAESVPFTDLDGAGESEISRPPGHLSITHLYAAYDAKSAISGRFRVVETGLRIV